MTRPYFMATRQQNEREYPNWDDLPNGGRRYWKDRKGRANGYPSVPEWMKQLRSQV
jgi:hypothetical protein